MTDAQKALDNKRYVVIGDNNSTSVMATEANEGDARKAAERLAAANDGVEYGVYQFIGSAILEPKVTWRGVAAVR